MVRAYGDTTSEVEMANITDRSAGKVPQLVDVSLVIKTGQQCCGGCIKTADPATYADYLH